MATILARLAAAEKELARREALKRAPMMQEYVNLLRIVDPNETDQERLFISARALAKDACDVKNDLAVIEQVADIEKELVHLDRLRQECRDAAQAARKAADDQQAAIEAARRAEGERLHLNNKYQRLLRLEGDRGALKAKHPDLFPRQPAKTTPAEAPATTPPASTSMATDPPTGTKKTIKRARLAT